MTTIDYGAGLRKVKTDMEQRGIWPAGSATVTSMNGTDTVAMKYSFSNHFPMLTGCSVDRIEFVLDKAMDEVSNKLGVSILDAGSKCGGYWILLLAAEVVHCEVNGLHLDYDKIANEFTAVICDEQNGAHPVAGTPIVALPQWMQDCHNRVQGSPTPQFTAQYAQDADASTTAISSEQLDEIRQYMVEAERKTACDFYDTPTYRAVERFLNAIGRKKNG